MNNKVRLASEHKKTTPTKPKRYKVLNTRDKTNIMKISPTQPRASLPRFHLNGSS